jgi:hypothetical protein
MTKEKAKIPKAEYEIRSLILRTPDSTSVPKRAKPNASPINTAVTVEETKRRKTKEPVT